MAMFMTSLLVGTISLVVVTLLVVALMVCFPPSTALAGGAVEEQNHQDMVYVLKAVISGEALVYLVVNLKLLYRWVSLQATCWTGLPDNVLLPGQEIPFSEDSENRKTGKLD